MLCRKESGNNTVVLYLLAVITELLVIYLGSQNRWYVLSYKKSVTLLLKFY